MLCAVLLKPTGACLLAVVVLLYICFLLFNLRVSMSEKQSESKTLTDCLQRRSRQILGMFNYQQTI